jgi:hypothetical protein
MKSANGPTTAVCSHWRSFAIRSPPGSDAAGHARRRLGREEDGHHADRDQGRHQREGEPPAAELRGIERAGARGEHAEAVAPLRDGGAGALLLGAQQLDAVGVDHDVLARRQEGDDRGGERRLPRVGERIDQAEPQDRARQQHLDGKRPAAAPAEQARQQRQRQPVDQRRPQELEAVGHADQREQADRGQGDAALRHAIGERRARERERQPLAKPMNSTASRRGRR